MRRYMRTPSGLLGIITIVLILAFAVTTIVIVTTSNDRTQCIASELAGPWISLKETFRAPPGDPVAREKALKAVTAGINRLEHLERHC